MKRPKRVQWLTLLVALGLLYVGIDRMFFDRIVGSDPLARIERTLSILVGTLLVAVSISLFVAAWTGRSLAAMNTNSIKEKLLAHAFCAAPGALVFGFCLVRTIFMRAFNLLFWSAMTGIAIYPVCRDAKRLADAAGPSQIPSR